MTFLVPNLIMAYRYFTIKITPEKEQKKKPSRNMKPKKKVSVKQKKRSAKPKKPSKKKATRRNSVGSKRGKK